MRQANGGGDQGGRRPLIPYFPALDGLRGYFLIAVVLFHAGLSFRGALLTMSGFFCLSGFLIAGLLIAEWERSGRIDIRRFIAKRARRLLPAAMLAIVVSAVLWNTMSLRETGRIEEADVRADTNADFVAATFYVHNWKLILGPNWTGFRTIGYPDPPEHSPLTHFWSLAVEEQFYLAFPIVAFGALALMRRKTGLLVVGLVGLATVLILQPTTAGARGMNRLQLMDRIYAGTDVRMAEVLIGILLACVFSFERSRSWMIRSRVVQAAGVAVFALITYWLFTMGISSDWLYNRGFAVVGLLFAVMIAALTQGKGVLVALMSFAPLRWLGVRSYGMYVYHHPIIRMVDENLVGLGRWSLLGLRVGLTLAAGALSYRYLEQPIRRWVGRSRRSPATFGTAAPETA